MSRKKKFITTLASFCVLLTMLLFGVYASVIRRVNISGQINFRGEQVNATIVVEETKLKAKGHTFVNADYAQVETNLEYEIGGNQENREFKLAETKFSDTATLYSFRIKITSGMGTNVELQVEYQNLITNLPTYITRTESLTVNGQAGTSTQKENSNVFNWTNIKSGETAVWTVIFEVKNPETTPNIASAKYIDETFTIKRV